MKSASDGNYSARLQSLEKALARCNEKELLADKAIVEDQLGSVYFLDGKLEEAKKQFANALSDAVSSSNVVLQADVLVALSALSRAVGNITEALEIGIRALDTARRSKSLLIQARALGELGNLQLTAGKKTEARTSIEEALRIDRLNNYGWEASHLLYLAWVAASAPDSNLEKAIEIATSARDLAIQKENYLVFVQATTSLGQAYIRKGQTLTSIQILVRAQNGEAGSLFKFPASYRVVVAQPFLKVVLLEALAQAYQAGQRSEDALKTWQQLYETAKAAGFTLAGAEAAQAMADLYNTKKAYDQSISYYLVAAKEWEKGGNQPDRINALSSAATLLSNLGQIEKAIQIDEEILPLLKASGDVGRQFLMSMAIVEGLQQRGSLSQVEKALNDAESLLSADLTVANVSPQFVVDLYIRLAELEEKKNRPLQELVALEKAMTPAEVLGMDRSDASRNAKPMAWLDAQVKQKLASIHALENAETAYGSGDFVRALLYYELIEHFEQTDARWNGKSDEYAKSLQNNKSAAARVIDIPFKIIAAPEGAKALENNLQQAGPIAQMARLPILWSLVNHHVQHQESDMVVKFATAALPYLKLGENDNPHFWDVEIVCELASSQMFEKDLKSAVQTLEPCLRSARRLGDPKHLALAHQTNVWVLEATGMQDQAQESVQYLLKQSPDDPLHYVQLAQLKTQQGNKADANAAWRHALELFKARKDLDGAASAHLGLASSTDPANVGGEEQRSHIEAALALYKQLASPAGQVKANVFLAEYYADKKDILKARKFFETALILSRQAKDSALEAGVLSQIGRSYQSLGDLVEALEFYRQSSDIYHKIDDSADEAFQLRNQASVLDSMHEPEEALRTALKGKRVADTSDSWLARYWVRRLLAFLYGSQGEYESGLTTLREARQISDSANQPLNSAWVALALVPGLITVGDWEEALDQVNFALPVFRQFKDKGNEFAAYTALMDIYGGRESELKDLDKALEVYRLVEKTDLERAAALSSIVVEIYWQLGRFKEAIAKATEAINYYEQTKDELGKANALISLAEVQRSDGDVREATKSLEKAEQLVKNVKNFYTTGRFYYGQAGLLKKEGRFSEAIGQYQHVIELLEQFKSTSNSGDRRSVSETYSFIYDELIDTYYSLRTVDKHNALLSADKALEYTELNKSRLFANTWGQVFMDGLRRQVPAQLQERERVMLAQHASLQSELQESLAGGPNRLVKEVEKALHSLKKEQSELVQQLQKASPAYAEARYPQNVALMQIPVHSDELLIEFKMLPDSVLVWMVGGSAGGSHLIAFYKVDRPRQWFEKRIVSIRDAFNTNHPEQFDPKISEELFRNLFPEPFAEHLKTAQSVIFIPDNILFLLPFEMLSPGASRGQYVLLKTATDYFPSAAAFRLSRASVRTRPAWQEQFIGIADPITSREDERYVAPTMLANSKPPEPDSAQQDTHVFRGVSVDKIRSRGFALERLPDTATEVKGIASLFSGGTSTAEVRTGVQATKHELLQTDLGRFRFVHFATHGILPVEAGIKEPALVLSYEGTNSDDMLLTLSEVFQLKLQADMVVLSACNTGSGKVSRAEGVASLGMAFLAAGASSATVSLWHVSDNSTAILMQEFYRNLLKGMPKAASLAAARSTLVSQGFDNPFFWAPFVLTGE